MGSGVCENNAHPIPPSPHNAKLIRVAVQSCNHALTPNQHCTKRGRGERDEEREGEDKKMMTRTNGMVIMMTATMTATAMMRIIATTKVMTTVMMITKMVTVRQASR